MFPLFFSTDVLAVGFRLTPLQLAALSKPPSTGRTHGSDAGTTGYGRVFYLESQHSFRHPNEYYTASEEPDGTWFNPHGLFGLGDGARIDAADFHRLYNGFPPDGLDMTFSVDKSVSALWAIAVPDMRAGIEGLAIIAARAALEDTVLKYAGYTRITRGGGIVPVPADLMAAVFPHGTSRENDPQLHIHTTILNVARTCGDGRYRAHHQHPAYGWSKAAGALFRAYLAWDLRRSLGVRMERYGRNGAYTRIPGLPEDLLTFWSKRRKAIVAKAGELGIPVRGNASRLAGVNKLTRTAKSPGKPHDNDPEVRYRRWRGEAGGFAEREALIAAVTGNDAELHHEELRNLTEDLDVLPGYLAREEAVFRRPDMVEAAANAAAGLLGREAAGTAIERVRRNPEIEALELPRPRRNQMPAWSIRSAIRPAVSERQ
ncbi:MAG: relaxase domain-containing protein [Alphaproteobacteria bacterium]|nr:relaxase domain-containing protein [Alphaproteobacteria bacterium]